MDKPRYLGPYEIRRTLGRGGMGTVFQAVHSNTQEEVAIKLIAEHVADDQRFRRRFDAEVETLKRLRHPGIVRLIGYGEEHGQLFYSMELVHGQTLQQRIREVKRMGWLPATDITVQICLALKHAHDIGVIHRDLKPANLIITDSGKIKLVDFGIAKLFGFGEQTMAGSVLGTADYMAPEQAGTGAITTRTDLYALGSVMYAMLAGRSPFSGKRITEVIDSLKRERPVPLDLINPDVPMEIVSIVSDLLEKEPQDRPPTALAVMNRLKATQHGLQRSKTVAMEELKTQAGPEVDEASVFQDHGRDTQQTKATDVPGGRAADRPTDKTGVGRTDGAVAEKAKGSALNPQRSRTAGDRNQALRKEAFPGSDEVTVASELLETADEEGDPKRNSNTHFQSVDDQPASQSWKEGEPLTSRTSWTQWLSIVGMVAVLAGGVWLFVRSASTPSADELYTRIRQAADDDELTMADATMRLFIRTYPADRRANEVDEWLSQAELQRTLNRLRGRARARGGASRLDPHLSSFLEAMQYRETSGDKAIEHLQAWLDVFATGEIDDGNSLQERFTRREVDQLATLANHEIDRLMLAAPDDQIDPRLESLLQRIEHSNELTPAKQDRLLRGLRTLYGDKPWAQPALDQLKD
ncbi:MAG: serine/threonine-protein kinase [Planctomycetota bacterium]